MNALATISRIYTLNNIQKDARKLMKKKGWNRALTKAMDRDALLHRAGLTTYNPGRDAIAGISIFAAGCIIGGIIGMMMAPKPGQEIRRDITQRASSMRRGEHRPEYHA